MSKVIDMLGRRYGKLTVIKFAGRWGRREYFWQCQCECGAIRNIRGSNLRNGKVNSCGCVHGVAISNPVTHAQLLTLLKYDKKTGKFTWRVASRKYKRGDTAGKFNPSIGYIFIVLNKRIYGAHSLAWLYVTGRWSKDEVDHRNRERTDNRWSNLREATHKQNLANSNRPKTNTSGYKGVARYPGGFRAYIRGKHIGVFADAISAAYAYDEQARILFGEFAGLNFDGGMVTGKKRGV